MRATFFSNCLNFLPSPTRRARSRMAIQARVAMASRGGGPLATGAPAPGPDAFAALGRACLRLRPGGLAAPATLVAMALDLTVEILRHEVDRVGHVVGGLARPQRGALEVQGHLGHACLTDRGVLLLLELDLELGEWRHLPFDLRELLLDSLLELVADRQV